MRTKRDELVSARGGFRVAYADLVSTHNAHMAAIKAYERANKRLQRARIAMDKRTP